MASEQNSAIDKALARDIEAVDVGTKRILRGPLVFILTALAAVFSLFEIAVLGIFIIDIWVFEAIALIFVFVLGFMLIPEGAKDKKNITWRDILFILMGVTPNIYVIIRVDHLSRWYGTEWTTFELVLSVMLMLALLILIRRSFGWSFVTIVLGFLVYLFFGHYLPIDLFGHPYLRPDRAVSFLFGPEAIYGSIASVFVHIIFLFMLFSAFFQASGASDFMVKVANSFAGRWRGGPAKVAVIASSLFGTISGNSVANVATIGVFTIPMMKKAGFPSHLACAVEATASTGGQIMPPVMGAGAFLMAEFLGIPYRDIVVAAAIPAILYYVCVFYQVDLESVKSNLRGLPDEEIPNFWKVVKEGGYLMLPVLVLLYMLFVQGSSITRAALFTVASVVIVSWLRKRSRMGPRAIWEALANGGRNSVPIGAICVGAGIMVGVINVTGLGVQFSSAILQLGGGNLALILVFTALACIILGLALPTTAAYIVAAAVAAPALVKLGVMPLAAHLFVFYFSIISPISPPVGTAYYAAAGIGGAPINKTGWTAVRLAIVAFVVPFIFVYHTELIMKGEPLAIIQIFLTSIVALAIFAMGVVGTSYVGGIRWYLWQRALFMVGAAGLMVPGWTTNLIGLAIVVIALIGHPQFRQLLARRKNPVDR